MTERPLPDRRSTVRQAVRISGQKVYLDLGFHDDSTIGEMFIVVERTGAERRWLYDEIARLASKLIQHGSTAELVAESWIGVKGKPAGPVQGDARIKNCTSILDWVGRSILVNYYERHDLAHVKGST